MYLLIISLVIWILILIYNATYSFLPSNIQSIRWIKIAAIIASIIILICGIKQAIREYRNYRFAYISAKNGTILKKKNFPWSITKTTTRDGDIVYIVNERYGDASEVSVIPDKPNDKYVVYNAIDGVGVKFKCPDAEIPDFKIIIRKCIDKGRAK